MPKNVWVISDTITYYARIIVPHWKGNKQTREKNQKLKVVLYSIYAPKDHNYNV